jgi:ribosomal protein S18 acetylase RimI-like enzyme
MTIQRTITPEYVSSWCTSNGRTNRCCCEASYIPGQGIWYLNRLFVAPKLRGKGVGRMMLQALVSALVDSESVRRLVVDPGGYGSNVSKLKAFYRKCGFVNMPKVPGRLYIDITEAHASLVEWRDFVVPNVD